MMALLHFSKTSTSDDIIREITSSEGERRAVGGSSLMAPYVAHSLVCNRRPDINQPRN